MGIVIKCDVLVIGGGAAGIAAAISAARCGANTILLEKYGFPGGLATAGMVGSVCGAYLRSQKESPTYISNGIICEFIEILSKNAKSKPFKFINDLYILPFTPWSFIQTANQIISDTKNLTSVYHGFLTSLDIEYSSIVKTEAFVYNQKIIFKPLYVVDCTGEALAFHLIHETTEEDNNYNSPAFIFSVGGIDEKTGKNEFYISIIREIKRAVKNNLLPPECEKISFIPTIPSENKIYIKINLPNLLIQNWNKMTGLELMARNLAEGIINFFRNNIKGFENIFLHQFASQVGIRIGQRICGNYTLSKDDILNCRKFDDGIACGCWPMELWKTKDSPEMVYLPEEEYYEIPLRCLTAKNTKNLLSAGRCISADIEASASSRVIGTCLLTGYAAGKAAALLASGKDIQTAVGEIRKEQVRGF